MLVFSKSIYTMRHCSARAEKGEEARQGKNHESEFKEDSKSILKLELNLSRCDIFTQISTKIDLRRDKKSYN